ncbi:hypothetical protein THF5H11_10518 [Vibrio jasicida]|nr:hypothetical protein THF5H11_10518 [Vibrio jasicida]
MTSEFWQESTSHLPINMAWKSTLLIMHETALNDSVHIGIVPLFKLSK